MKLEIPDELYDTFITFLDCAQADYNEEEVEKFEDDEKKVYCFIRSLIDYPASPRLGTKVATKMDK